jgi:hypothetical protein
MRGMLNSRTSNWCCVSSISSPGTAARRITSGLPKKANWRVLWSTTFTKPARYLRCTRTTAHAHAHAPPHTESLTLLTMPL